MANFDLPKWAGKPSPGFHLDVMKSSNLVEKLIIDEKSFYLFGRNSDSCDFQLNHESCSRVHCAIIYHKLLKRFFIMDLGSTHGTYLGSIQLEPNKPQQLPVDSVILFGASTRTYVLREKPPTRTVTTVTVDGSEDSGGKSLLSLPEDDNELDDLTEYNTAHNKRISSLVIENEKSSETVLSNKRKHKARLKVKFGKEEIINPEDIDPSVGRFRNMIQTTVIPLKKQRNDKGVLEGIGGVDAYVNLPIKHSQDNSDTRVAVPGSAYSVFSGLTSSIRLNPAPDVGPLVADDVPLPSVSVSPATVSKEEITISETLSTKKHKVYAKEAWPGKVGSGPLLVS